MRDLNPQQLATEIGGSPNRYRILFKEGQIPGEQVSPRRVLFDKAEVVAAIHENQLNVKGFHGVPEPEDPELESAEKDSYIAASKAAIACLQEKYLAAMEAAKYKLATALLRKLADAIDSLHNSEE